METFILSSNVTKKIEHEVCFTPLCDASKSCKASEKVYIKSLWDVPNLFKNLNLIFSLIEILHESLGTTLLMLITMFLFPGSKASKRFVYWLLHLDLLFICYVSLEIFDQFSFSKVTQRFFVNCRRIVWVCLTILWNWRLKG